MKKLLFLATLVFGFTLAGTADASLWEFFNKQGKSLPSLSDRSIMAEICGISNYVGTAEQNGRLEGCLDEPPLFFGSAPTPTSSAQRMYVEAQDYQLFNGGAAGDTTLVLDDLEDIYGNEITMDDLGTKGYGRINPDGVSESITFTGITTNANGTKTLTGVKTVLAKYPYTETSGLVRSHSIGSLFRLTNTAGFYNDLANKINNEVIDGLWTFGTGTIQLLNSNFGIRSNGTNLQWSIDGFLNSYNFTSSSISTLLASSTMASKIVNSQIGVIVSSTKGMYNGADGQGIYQTVSTTLGLRQDTNGIYITTTPKLIFTSTGQLDINASSTPTAGVIPIANASSSLTDWVSVPKLLGATTTNFTNTANTSEFPLMPTTTIPAGALGTSNMLRVRMHFSTFQIPANKLLTFHLYYGNTIVASTTFSNPIAGNVTSSVMAEFLIMANNASNSQEVQVDFTGLKDSVFIATAPPYLRYFNVFSSSVDSSTAQPLKATMQFSDTDGNYVITVANSFVELLR